MTEKRDLAEIILSECKTEHLYTEEELQEKLGYVEGLYTPEEFEKAVKKEREKCALICDRVHNQDTSGSMLAYWCGSKIRTMGEDK